MRGRGPEFRGWRESLTASVDSAPRPLTSVPGRVAPRNRSALRRWGARGGRGRSEGRETVTPPARGMRRRGDGWSNLRRSWGRGARVAEQGRGEGRAGLGSRYRGCRAIAPSPVNPLPQRHSHCSTRTLKTEVLEPLPTLCPAPESALNPPGLPLPSREYPS